MDASRVVIPQPRSPMPATLVPTLHGERVIVADATGAHYGYRAWSEVYTRPNGDVVVDIVPELEWWRWKLLRVFPDFQRWPAEDVWVE